MNVCMERNMRMDVKKVLTIAGSDCSGGAGIQADLKTIQAHGMYGMSVLTSVTAQNTTGVSGVFDVTPEYVGKQMEAVFEDIMPDAVKIGMVSNAGIIREIVKQLKKYRVQNIVADPVMVSTSGCRLLEKEAEHALIQELLPIADIITPNIPEAEVLSGIRIRSEEDMAEAAKLISEMNRTAVLIKGGHLTDSANDLLYADGSANWYEAERIDNHNTHGTGCTLSSAIACNLAENSTIKDSVSNAKQYVYRAISAGLDLGKGDGPLWHNVEAISR